MKTTCIYKALCLLAMFNYAHGVIIKQFINNYEQSVKIRLPLWSDELQNYFGFDFELLPSQQICLCDLSDVLKDYKMPIFHDLFFSIKNIENRITLCTDKEKISLVEGAYLFKNRPPYLAIWMQRESFKQNKKQKNSEEIIRILSDIGDYEACIVINQKRAIELYRNSGHKEAPPGIKMPHRGFYN